MRKEEHSSLFSKMGKADTSDVVKLIAICDVMLVTAWNKHFYGSQQTLAHTGLLTLCGGC